MRSKPQPELSEQCRQMRVLLATFGTTPQVVTETVWALASRSPAWIPDRILLLVTGSGSRLLVDDHERDGLTGRTGQLQKLGVSLDIPGLAERVEIIEARSAGGALLDDLRKPADIEAFAETLLQIVATLTSDPRTVLHLSMAGGRKTMSFVAGQVMSLFARAQDELSHVLVHPPELESSPAFWWPDACHSAAQVSLHFVPFIRLRAWLGPERLRAMAAHGFASAVDIANEAAGNASATLDLARGTLRIADTNTHLTPRETAVLAFAAIAGKRRQDVTLVRRWHPVHRKWAAPALDGDRQAACELWASLAVAGDLPRLFENLPPVSRQAFDLAVAQLASRMANGDQRGTADPTHPYGELFGQPLSRLRRKLRDALPPLLARRVMDDRRIACDLAASLTIHGPPALRVLSGWPAEIQLPDDDAADSHGNQMATRARA